MRALDAASPRSTAPVPRHAVRPADALSDALGFARDGGVWVKDETGNVGGSHKARHLFTILLHLVAAEALGLARSVPASTARLAIASCGNAALAAATLAARSTGRSTCSCRTWADPAVLGASTALGAGS